MHIVIIPGTNRLGSKSGRLAPLIATHYQALQCNVDVLTLELTPEFLEPTAYQEPKPAISALVSRFLAADGVVFIVPEYNGSYPGVLKLFVDMLPYPQGFDHRPCAFIGLAAGQFHGLRAVEHLQGVAGYRQALLYPGRVFIGESARLFDTSGALNSPELGARLVKQAEGFTRFIGHLRPS